MTGLLRCSQCHGPMPGSTTRNTLKDGTKKRIRYYSCANFRRKGSSVCRGNSVRADDAEKFVLDRLKDVLLIPQHLNQIVDEMNQKIDENRKPWKMELDGLHEKIESTKQSLEKWKELVKANPELSSELDERITGLEIEYIESNQRKQELIKLLDAEGQKIKRKDAVKVIKLVNAKVAASKNKAEIKAILRTFIDKITFNKETKSDYKIYMTFTQDVIDILNERAHKEPTAGKNAVGSFYLKYILKLAV